jgi:3-hydroxy-9,10-secoandrosta-1,3,5(10)-triene-9,17-dione monooxygenase
MVLPETMTDLHRLGLIKHFQPVRWGGIEAPWGIQFDIGRVLAQACPSTAWIATVVAANNCYACRFPMRLQEEIYGDGPDVLVTNASVSRNVSVKPEAGGFRVSGAWKFASGIDHASWVLIVGGLEGAGGAGAALPARLFMLVPKRDYRIVDDWFVSGMKGTGSKDIVLDGAFVPAYRALGWDAFWNAGPPGGQPSDPFIWRRDLSGYFGTSLLGPIVGAAEGICDAYIAATRVRVGVMMGDVPAAQETVQIRVAESTAELKAARLLLERQMHDLRQRGEAGAGWSTAELVEMTRDRAWATRLCQVASERLVASMGALGVFDSNPVQRYWHDLNAAATQIAVNYDRNLVPYGRLALGLEPGRAGMS